MTRGYRILLELFILILLIGAAVLIYQIRSSNNTSKQDKPAQSQPSEGKNTTLVGKLSCLKLKVPSETQTQLCALGLTQDDGKSYALNTDESGALTKIPGGTRIEASGELVAADDSQYAVEGILKITKIKAL